MVHDLEGSAFVDTVERFRGERRSFYLSPGRWRSSRVAAPLDWTEIKFQQGGEIAVPEEKGIYAFVVRHQNNHFPVHGFIMYVGITGHRAAERNLRQRYIDYLREKRKNKRPKVHYMLNKYENDIFFNYVAFEGTGADLEQLEIDLNDALIPPVGKKDFSAEIKALRDALE